MQFRIKKVAGSLDKISNSSKSIFVSETNTKTIELNYKYEGEPNNGRVILNLEFTINEKSALERYGIESQVELPYQYPKYFEMLKDSQDKIAIPHSKGIYIIDLEKSITNIVKYKSSGFQYCYFYENEMIIVESKFLTIVNISTLDERKIDLQSLGNVFINGVKISNSEIQVIVQNTDINDCQMLLYRRSDLTQLKTLNLSKLIKDEDVLKFLDEKRSSKLAFISNFSFSSIIASWRYIPNIKKNSFIGYVMQWEEPIKKEMHFERVEHFGIIEVELIDSTTIV